MVSNGVFGRRRVRPLPGHRGAPGCMPLLGAASIEEAAVSTQQRKAQPDGARPELTRRQIEALEDLYGNRYLLEPAPTTSFPPPG